MDYVLSVRWCCIWSCLMCIHGKQNGYSVSSKLGEAVLPPIASKMVRQVCSSVIVPLYTVVRVETLGMGKIVLKRDSHGNQMGIRSVQYSLSCTAVNGNSRRSVRIFLGFRAVQFYENMYSRNIKLYEIEIFVY